jgi:hypothetical protein
MGFGFILASALFCAGNSAAQRGNQVLIFRKHVIMDQEGFQMEVLHLLAPKDWQFQGDVKWDYRTSPPNPTVTYTVTSPDGRSVAEQFAPATFYWTQDQLMMQSYTMSGQAVKQPMPAAEYIKTIWVPQHRRDASGVTVLQTQDLPELAAQSRKLGQQQMEVFGQISPLNFPFEIRTEAARVNLKYQRNGEAVVEEITVLVNYFITSTMNMYGGSTQDIAWTPSVFSMRAPAREMNEKARLFQVIADSRWDNPNWQLNCTRLDATITRDQISQQNAIFARMQEIHRTQQETSDIIVNSYNQRSATYDRIFQNYDQTIRGVETYVDPDAHSQVELPYGYNDAWTNGTDYIMSSDPAYNPNVGSTQSWQKLNHQR